MSEPSYGSGQSYNPQQGYGGGYGGQQYGQQTQGYGTGQQYGGGYGQPGQQPGPGGYQSGSYPSTPVPTPSAPRTPADRLSLVATVVTIVGYVCAGAGLLGFILWLTVDGNGTYRFATALQTLVVGLGFGGVNYAIGSWLSRESGTRR